MFDLFEKLIFDKYECGFICLCPCVYVMCCYVLSVIMYMGICMCDDSLAWARKYIEFSMNEKVDFSKWNFNLMKFCIGGHILKLCGGHLLRLCGDHLLRAKAPQSVTHGALCHAQHKVPHCRIRILLKGNMKVWKRQKTILMNFFYSISKKSWHIIHCIIYKYVCIFV